ncbi:hypothetical protein C7374_105197 [Falsochrobactrum ovis]|uniref:Uncharacterized protein n=2 Tax=Falsochrobactrum ovis TaxID=1293442 RepID=A0A364JVK6_9HYPH|nr:hypothetical protein C7374_105197 [Falsochrobactrum ovis]
MEAKVKPAAEAKEKPASKRELPVLLLRNYWPHDGSGKRTKGSSVVLPADEARQVVKAGVGVRNDEF